MPRSVYFLVAGWVLASTAPLLAQDAVLGQIYGNGVHAYFGQDYLKAHQLFTSAIDGHSQDPRCFYFRGLSLLKLGRPQDAELDFQRGAKLESSSDAVRAYNVARSLERVQGTDRSTLEQYRLEARMAVLKKAEDESTRRYQQSQKELRDNLQKQSEGAEAPTVGSASGGAKSVDVPLDASKPAGTVPAASRPPDPFSEDGKAGDMKKGDAGAGTTPTEHAKLDTPKTDAAKPAGGAPDPFGGTGPAKTDTPAVGGALTPAVPVTPVVPVTPAVPAAGGLKAEAGDPFGDAGGAKSETPAGGTAKPAVPAAGGAKPDAGDPFGDTGGARAATPAGGAAKPAVPAAGGKADAGDPFGDPAGAKAETPAAGGTAKPAAAAAAASPFGDEPEKSPAKKPAAAPADDKKPAETAKKPADDKKASGEDPFGS